MRITTAMSNDLSAMGTVDMGWNTRRFQYPKLRVSTAKLKAFSLWPQVFDQNTLSVEKNWAKNVSKVFAGFLNNELNFNIY